MSCYLTRFDASKKRVCCLEDRINTEAIVTIFCKDQIDGLIKRICINGSLGTAEALITDIHLRIALGSDLYVSSLNIDLSKKSQS
jgi:hypothetical protein